MNARIVNGKRYYGELWVDDHRRLNPENPDLCICAVKIDHSFMTYYQCTRKRGHGPDGLYCKQHGKKHGNFKPKE